MPDQPNQGRQKHMLVVDDNHDLAQTYQDLFEAYDYRVTIANNGVQALKLILEKDVDVILCDLSMPQLEGDMFYTTVERVRPKLSQRFIFVTGNMGNPKYQAFLERVNPVVLYKPVAIDKLMEAVEGVFSQPT